mmetsp:Transcript_30097/g.54704  ORF Transcript_30097/g.54704 Transcript_30097/m.54704 type:complete len:259 (-) Transcript_30097:15-791(-)
MHLPAFALACLAFVGHGRRLQISARENKWPWGAGDVASDDDGESAGAMSDAELGMANLKEAAEDPDVMAEMLELLRDPEFVAEVKQMATDPAFQQEVHALLDGEDLSDLGPGMEQLIKNMADPDFKEQVKREAEQLYESAHEWELANIAREMTMMAEPEPRDWEVENLERRRAGEINDAELGFANLREALADPSIMAEVALMLQDPEKMAQVQEMLADPNFQQQARRAAEDLKASGELEEIITMIEGAFYNAAPEANV